MIELEETGPRPGELVLKHGGLKMVFTKDSTHVFYDHLPFDRSVVSADIGEDAIQNLMLYLFESQAKTAEEFSLCMKDIREFYAHYLTDRTALKMLATQIRLLNGKMP